jgi:hypothetical protein
MSALGEIDAMKVIADALEELGDEGARDRVVRWAWSRYSQQPLPSPERQAAEPSRKRAARSAPKKKAAKPSPSIVKDLNLRDQDGRSFSDFATEKKPGTMQDKCTVAVYYLNRVLAIPGISTDHVYTCFKDAAWKVPSNLYQTLVRTAHRTGWLDTSDMHNIVLTTRGETMVEYDLSGGPAGGDPG